MYIAVDALANVDDSKLSYMILPFDEDLLEAIEENLKEIRIDNEVIFPMQGTLLVRGEFHYVRKKLKFQITGFVSLRILNIFLNLTHQNSTLLMITFIFLVIRYKAKRMNNN